VAKIISMLTEMKDKGAKDMKVEEMVMSEYTKWVDDRVTELGFEIKTANSDIEKLVAFIEKSESDVARLGSSIHKLDGEIGEMDASKAAGKKQREAEHAEFLKEQQDFAETVDALQRAIQVLKSQNFDRPQAMAMVQKMAKSQTAMRKVVALLEMAQQDNQDGAPAVAAYEFQSGGVIDLLKDLLKKFKTQLSETETAEANSAHAHDMAALHATNTMEALNSDRDEQAARKGKTAAESAQAKGELGGTKKDLAEDEKVLADTKAVYATKKSTFETNQKVRAEELEAIGKAIEIISNPNVAGSYGKHINAAAAVQLAAKPVKLHAVSFLQMGSQKAAVRAVAVNRAMELLRARAQSTKSEVLSALVAQAADSPFNKVINMIEELLMKLKEEAAAEADHKQWCDKELHDNKLKREEHQSAVDRLMAEVEQLGSTIQSMSEEITTAAKEQAELTTAMSEATTARTDEKTENEATIKDSVQAQEAVKQALVVLQEFYNKAAGASLVQQKKQVPEMGAYTGQQSGKGGVIGMLEVIQADFSRLETDTRAAENAAASQYASFMSESKASKKAKHDREFKLKMDVDQVLFEQSQTKKDLTAEQEGLAAANKYYEDLKPSCVVVKVSFEERVAGRKDEIEALKEAYKILDDHSAGQ